MTDTSRRGPGRLAFAAALAGATPALLWPALQSGYPLLRFDSPAYVRDALSLSFFELRSPGYALFLRGVLAGGSLWPAVWIQSLVTSGLALRLAQALGGDPRTGLVAGICALGVAVVATSLPAHASTLMPDIFTSWLFLGGALCLVSSERLDAGLGAAACFASALVHTLHLPLAVAGLLACALVRAVWRPARGIAVARLVALAVAVALGLALSAALQRQLGGAPLGGHPAFVVARLHGHGLLVPILDLHCAQRGWRLCAHRDALTREADGEPGWWFLWDPESPLRAVGGFEPNGPELREIARAGTRSFLPAFVGRSLADASRQLFRVETHKGIVPEPASALAFVLRDAFPAEARRVAAADQSFRRPAVVLFPSLEGGLHAGLWASALFVGALCLRRGRPAGAWLLLTTAGFLVVHAVAVSFGTTPFGRYQGRVGWLMAYALVVAAFLLRSGDDRKRSALAGVDAENA